MPWRFDFNGVGRADENERADCRKHYADPDYHAEAPQLPLERHAHVHTPQTRHQRRNGDDQRNHRQQLHYHVQIVGNNGSVRIHGSR